MDVEIDTGVDVFKRVEANKFSRDARIKLSVTEKD